MKAREEKLLEDGRRLHREIDAAYEVLYEKLKDLGTLKRRIRCMEKALSSIQERLLSYLEMPQPTEDQRARRKRLVVATDDDDLPLEGL